MKNEKDLLYNGYVEIDPSNTIKAGDYFVRKVSFQQRITEVELGSDIVGGLLPFDLHRIYRKANLNNYGR